MSVLVLDVWHFRLTAVLYHVNEMIANVIWLTEFDVWTAVNFKSTLLKQKRWNIRTRMSYLWNERFHYKGGKNWAHMHRKYCFQSNTENSEQSWSKAFLFCQSNVSKCSWKVLVFTVIQALSSLWIACSNKRLKGVENTVILMEQIHRHFYM